MKCFKKILCVLCSLALCASFTACNFLSSKPTGKPNTNPTDGEIPDDNNVDITDPDNTEHDFKLSTQNGGTITYKCADCGEQKTVVITYDSGTQNAFSVKDNTITFSGITEKTVYDISGEFYGNIVIDAADSKLELQMSGLTAYSFAACPITVLSGDKVTLSAKKSTENYIFDMRAAVSATDETAISASIYAECDLDVQGKGSLSVKSVNNNGIHTKNDLNVKNLELQIDCLDNALNGNDSVTIESGSVILISRNGDGIKTTDSDVSSKGNQRGTVAITGGDVLIYAACDGIDAAYDVTVDESTATTFLQIFTDKYSKYSEEVTATSNDVYYVRFNNTTYKYSLKFYNDETDAVWHNSSTSKTVGSYYYFPIVRPSGYSYVQLYIYGSAQTQGQSEDYLARTEGMSVNNNYDTIALQSRGGELSYGWTNYTTNQGFGSGRPGGGFGGPGGMNDGNNDKGDHSTKGIKAANAITVSAGTLTVSAYDDAIHASNDGALENGSSPLGNVTVSGGSMTLRSNDDGLHADGNVRISSGNVTIVSSYEGIEGTTVEIVGGNTAIVSTDDGVNGTAKSGTSITVSGGNLYVYAGGDGVDSNSKTAYSGIIFSDGKSVIISTGNSDSSIDTENGYTYSGGYVIGIGRSGGMGSEATKCQNFTTVGTSKTLSVQQNAYLTVDGFVTVKMPIQINALVVCLGKTSASISSAPSTNYNIDGNGVYWVVS